MPHKVHRNNDCWGDYFKYLTIGNHPEMGAEKKDFLNINK